MSTLSKLAVTVTTNVTIISVPTPPTGTASPVDAGTTTNGGGIVHFLYQNGHYLIVIVGALVGVWHRTPLAEFARSTYPNT